MILFDGFCHQSMIALISVFKIKTGQFGNLPGQSINLLKGLKMAEKRICRDVL